MLNLIARRVGLAGGSVVVIGAEDVDHDGRHEVFVQNRRSVFVLDAVACKLTKLRNAAGDDYSFVVDAPDLPDATGLGCNDGALAGLKETGDAGGVVSWERSRVAIDGDRLVNGDVTKGTFRHGADDAAITGLGKASCYEDPLMGTYAAGE